MPIDQLSRRDVLKLASLFTAGGALPLLSAFNARAQAEPDAPLRIGYLPITDATPLLVAHNNGYFEEAGIKAEKPTLLRSWAQIIEAFISGQVNVVHLLTPMTVWARYGSKVPAKVVAWNHMSGSGLTVAPAVNKVADLGGQTVAIPFWYSIHNVVLQHLLRENGLTPVSRKQGKPAANEVNLVVMAPSDMPPAIASGQIAGYIVAEPFNAVAENLGVGKVLRFTGDVWRDHACCVVFMHERDLEQRPQWSQGVVNAIVRAQLWTRDNRAETARLLSREGPNRYTPHPIEALNKVLAPPASDRAAYLASGVIHHPEWDEKRIDFQPYPYPSYTEALVEKLKSTVIEADRGFLAELDPKHAARDLVDDRYVKRAIESMGGLTRFGVADSYTRMETISA
ncbi:ABC transporter substrate-binding protein [Bordetella genomosp. 1]|uniref:ABC transporter substrate-binding protein n=1 Tax=Bordetella genomosp. 1 TaxID=1395607 RepID=A0A261RY80_9BORD|nr:ABC transporter substrate-binding protein [Bordetella genomosp. 1]OZI29233.1 ABC transporter substrate-binding protein [Bordetella genomosp. 1]OZI65033.1 ABC transporter substrate-binding protein [Bordetella genomosp. 1]